MSTTSAGVARTPTPSAYAGRTVNIDVETIDYFKEEARRTGISYQNIINMYLGECAAQKKRLTFV